jgi:putative aldouronate transport system substrate-binding protein
MSAVLALSILLVACGGGGNNSTNQPGNTSGNTTNETAGNEQKNDSKDSEAPYEVVMAYMVGTNAPDLQLVQDEINKISKEKINATVKLVPINFSAWNQQVNLMMSGSEKLDLLVTASGFNYSGQVAKGQLLPLDDLLESNGQGIKGVVTPEYLDGSRVNGKLYGITGLREFAADWGGVFNKALLDKYNLDLSTVKTWEDLGPILDTIHKNEPTIAPLGEQAQNQTIATVMLSGIYDMLGDTPGVLRYDSKDMKLENIFETKEYADALALVRKWYQAGYIMKDLATSPEIGPNLVKNDKLFGYVANLKPGFEAQESRASSKEMAGLRLTEPLMGSGAFNGFMMSISKNSQNPEKAMEFMSLLYTDAEILNLLDWGIEGKHYEKKDDNIIGQPAGVTGDTGYSFYFWEIGNAFMTYIWEGNDPQVWEKTKEFNDSAIKSPAIGFTFSADPVKTEVAAVTNALNQYKFAIETGTIDPVKNLPEFNAKLKAAGIDKIIAEKQKQLDAWAQSK